MKTGRTFLLGVFAVAVLTLGLSASANAQGGYYDPYYRDDRRNDRRSDRRYDYNMSRVRDAARRIENRSEELEDRIDDALDRNRRLDGTRREDQIINLADQFQAAAVRFENSVHDRRNMDRSANEAQQLLQIGGRLDRIISRGRLRDGRLQSVWSQIRNDLRVVANAYNFNMYDTYNDDDDYRGRGRGNGGFGRRPF
jgi:hypothetical protein